MMSSTVRTINTMIQNAENRGQYLMADYAMHSMPISARIIRARSVKGIIQGYVLASGKWVAIKPETIRTF